MLLLGAGGKHWRGKMGARSFSFHTWAVLQHLLNPAQGWRQCFKPVWGQQRWVGRQPAPWAWASWKRSWALGREGKTAVSAAPAIPFLLLHCPSCRHRARPRKASCEATAHFCVQDRDKSRMVRAEHFQQLPWGHQQQDATLYKHYSFYYLILTCFSSYAKANAKLRMSPLISLGHFGPCSTSYACSVVLHLNPRTSGNGEGKSRTPMCRDLLCAVCSLQKLLFLAFTTLEENTLHFAANWSSEGKYTRTKIWFCLLPFLLVKTIENR